MSRSVISTYLNIVRAFERAGLKRRVDTRIVDHQIVRAASDQLRVLGRDLSGRPDRPDGIVCDSELRSIPLISGLAEGGAMVGKDFHYVCKQTSDILPMIFPYVDTIEEDVFAAGLELTQLLLRCIAGEQPEALQTLGEPIPRWRS